MTKRAIWGTVFVAVFVISMVVAVPLADAAGHIFISKTDVKVKNLTTLDATITVTAKIPKDGSAGAFGYGIITDSVGVNNVLAITTHAGITDHSSQTTLGDPLFHAHVLDLAAPGSLGDTCVGTGDAVVDFASSIASGNNIDAQHKVIFAGNQIKVQNVPVSDLNDAGVEAIVAFLIIPDATPDPSTIPLGTIPSPLPFLCLNIVGIGVAP